MQYAPGFASVLRTPWVVVRDPASPAAMGGPPPPPSLPPCWAGAAYHRRQLPLQCISKQTTGPPAPKHLAVERFRGLRKERPFSPACCRRLEQHGRRRRNSHARALDATSGGSGGAGGGSGAACDRPSRGEAPRGSPAHSTLAPAAGLFRGGSQRSDAGECALRLGAQRGNGSPVQVDGPR